ncbi:MAG TPA: NUDIX hydrolase [Candidatus Limnocylindria bacterium]|jgi:ADP-ribose pyrophosphatase
MPERTVSSRREFEGRLLSLRVDDVELESGRRTTREVVEHPGAVAILAWDGERLAAVRQWRQAAGAELLEIPAGTLEPGESPLVTAQRELGEECGLTAASWEAGPAFYTAPGFSTELLTLFLATELSSVNAAPPEDEALERAWITLGDALASIEDGRIRDAKSLVGILWLARHLAPAES